MVKPKILHYSIFGDNEYGHGGQKRTNQILKLFKEDYIIEEIKFDFLLPRNYIKLSFYLFYGIISYFQLKVKFSPSILGLIKIGFYYKQCQAKVNFDNIKFIVIEDFRNFGVVLNLFAKKQKIPTIGVVHNIDSLVPQCKSNFTNLVGQDYFEEEINLLKDCSGIITISYEECWLLGLNHIPSIYLPFLPSKSVLDKLNQIKNKRNLIEPKLKPLLLGTVNNDPSRLGMIELINMMEEWGINCDVVGFGSEILQNYLPNLSFTKIHGSVSIEELENFQINCSAMMVYQPPTTGVLTRIIECLLCGIPVYGNESALRSYHYLNGIFNLKDYAISNEYGEEINLKKYYLQVEQAEKQILTSAKKLN